MKLSYTIAAIVVVVAVAFFIILRAKAQATAYEEAKAAYLQSGQAAQDWLTAYDANLAATTAACEAKALSGIWDPACFGKADFKFNLASFFS